jgi:hypothetical protein
MRYHLESYLPIEAFKPRGGVGGMTLHGGGGGVISAVTDTISNALGTAGGESGILGGLADFDDAVATSVDGGWAGLAEEAAVIAATYLGGPLGGAAARGALEYTHGGEDRENALRTAAEQAAVSAAASYSGGYSPLAAGATKAGLQYTHGGEDRKNALKSGLTTAGMQLAMQGAKDYLSSSDIEAPVIDNSDFTYSSDYSPDYAPPPDMDLGAPYVDAPDGANLLTPDPNADPTFTPKKIDLSQSDDDYSNVLNKDGVTAAFADPNDVFYKDFLNNPQNPINQEVLASSVQSTSVGLSPEEKFELMMQNAQEAPMSSNFRPAGEPSFMEDPIKNLGNRASDALDYVKNAPEKTLDYLTKTPIKEMGSDLYKFAGDNYGKIGLGALALSSMSGRQPQPQPSPAGYSSEYGPYTGGYGSPGGVADPYLLRNRITASNVYNYRNPNTSRYAEGGEVKHFAYGGISNAVTRLTQPIEKAIVQPVGQALPFLRDAAPYAGILAAPFITSPFAAAGVGALSSGFGRPGSGFDMKRALMGGIAAYGASTVGAGLEAAGTTPEVAPISDLATVPPGTVGEGVVNQTSNLVKEAPRGFFRDTDAMQKGVGNLLSSDSDAAMARFGTKAGTFKSGVPIVMGISGMTAIDEANKMREEAERSARVGRQEQADMLARISKGRKRAEQAVRENPYMYAMGGQVDDELGGDYSAMGMDQGNMQRGLFGLGYAAGGMPNLALSKLSQPAFNEGAVGGMQRFAAGGDVQHYLFGGNISAIGPSITQSVVESMLAEKTAADEAAAQAAQAEAAKAEAGKVAMVGKAPYIVKNPLSDELNPDPLNALNVYDYMSKDKRRGYAAGGAPRFLSGGGDGMSDSIPATIEGKQEARLADGEFVIPADVVSHLGNGSSKAGAKQLYSMMDRIRKARTGNEKQGRQIKPNKLMPA